MLQLVFFAILVIQARAYNCGDPIKTEVILDYDQIVGNWTYVFHWDKLEDDKGETYPVDHYTCPAIDISEANDEDVESKKDSCKDNHDDQFDYDYAKYKLVAPELMLSHSLITVGDDRTIMETCGLIAGLEVRRVTDNYILMINYEFGNMVELLAKKVPTLRELKCVVDHIDVVKGLDGEAYCYV